jgi:transposase
MNKQDIKRLYVIQQVEDKKLSGVEAGKHLGLSLRQIRRLVARYGEKGATGLLHGNRGRAAHNRTEEKGRAEIRKLAEEDYRDYNDSHFTEELAEEPAQTPEGPTPKVAGKESEGGDAIASRWEPARLAGRERAVADADRVHR